MASGVAPDLVQVKETFLKLEPLLTVLCEIAEEIVDLTSQASIPVHYLTVCHGRLHQLAHEARILGRTSPAFSPITSASFRETCNLRQPDLHGMAREHARAYDTWRHRTWNVIQRLGIDHLPTRRVVYASTA